MPVDRCLTWLVGHCEKGVWAGNDFTSARITAELLGGYAKEVTELVDRVGVGIDGGWGQVSQLHVLSHAADVRIESSIEWCFDWLLGPEVGRSETDARFHGVLFQHGLQTGRAQVKSEELLKRAEEADRGIRPPI